MYSNKQYSVKLYIDITYINVLSIIYLCIIYFAYAISKCSTFLKYYFWLVLFTGAATAAVFGNVIVTLTC